MSIASWEWDLPLFIPPLDATGSLSPPSIRHHFFKEKWLTYQTHLTLQFYWPIHARGSYPGFLYKKFNCKCLTRSFAQLTWDQCGSARRPTSLFLDHLDRLPREMGSKFSIVLLAGRLSVEKGGFGNAAHNIKSIR